MQSSADRTVTLASGETIAVHLAFLRPQPDLETAPRTLTRRRVLSAIESALVPAADVLAMSAAALWVLPHTWAALAYAAAVLVLLAVGLSNGVHLDPRVGDDAPAIVRSVAVPLLVLAPFVASSHLGMSVLSRAPLVLGVVCAARVLAYAVVRRLRGRGLLVEDAVVVGAGQIGQGLVETLLADRRYGMRPIGFLEDDPYDRLPLPVIGTTNDLGHVLAETGVRRVVVAFGAASDASMVSVLRACDDARVAVYVLPRFFELGLGGRLREADEVRGISLIRLRRSALRRSSRAIKRAFDIVIAAIALALAAPVMGAVAVAVRLSSPGPILFRQRRAGRGARPFDLLKFRSMRVNDDADITWSVGQDPRVTRVGAVLRRTSLDELPQLWNVLRGDMSLVGPRPERPHFIEILTDSIPGYGDRLRVPAGLTGWSQIHGLRGDTSIADRAAFDNYYVEHWSLWLDVQIIVRTVRAMLAPSNA